MRKMTLREAHAILSSEKGLLSHTFWEAQEAFDTMGSFLNSRDIKHKGTLKSMLTEFQRLQYEMRSHPFPWWEWTL